MTGAAPPPEPVKRVLAALWTDAKALQQALRELAASWGPIDFEGPDRDFDVTDYYRAEMGDGLKRRLVSFEALASARTLVEDKLAAVEIEKRLRGPGGRGVNLDAGYLDDHKLVLASLKRAGQKLYLDKGVYADIIVRYARGRFKPLEWTFPDFFDGRYDEELLEIRRRYMDQLRALRLHHRLP